MSNDGCSVDIKPDGIIDATFSFEDPIEKAKSTLAYLRAYHDRDAYVEAGGDPAAWDTWHESRLAHQRAYTEWWDSFSEAERNAIEDEMQREYEFICTEIDDDNWESDEGLGDDIWDWVQAESECRVELRHGWDRGSGPPAQPPMPEKHVRWWMDMITDAAVFLKTVKVISVKR